MASTMRPNRINVDLQHYKQPWLDYCKANHTTPSDAFRQVVAKLTGAGGQARSAGDSEPAPKSLGKVRKEIKLTPEEIAGITLAAERDGFQFSRWVIALIRAHLGSGAQLGQKELEALARSNMQILALGRNVNQIARALHANPELVDQSKLNELDAIKAAIKNHSEMVAGVLEANVKRWSAK